MIKGCSFIEKKGNIEETFIPEEFNEEQKMIKEMVIDFCKKEIETPMIKKGKELYASDPEDLKEIITILEKSAELGFCGVGIGQEYGGMDLDFNTGLLFSEAVSHGFSFATTIGCQTSIGSLPIVYYGNETQKKAYLPGISNAKIKASYCLTEPNAGSDANSGKSKATLNKEGTHYLINGQKMWITNGGFADLFIVFAKIDDDDDLSAFIVEKAFGGITLGAEEKKMGIKGSSTVQVFFNNCPVPVENLLSERGKGFKIALNILNSGRIKLAAGTTGGAKLSLNKAITYAKERVQFDKAIANFGAIQNKIATMLVHTLACESAVYQTGRKIDLKTKELKDNGLDESNAKLKALREFAVECALLKVKCSENADYVIDEAIQIYGGMGYSAEAGIEMGYRDARITRIYEGTNEINRMLAVAELTKRYLKTKEINLKQAGKKIPSTLASNFFRLRSRSIEHYIQDFKSCFLLLSNAAGKKLGKKLEDEQEIIMNLSDILNEAFIAEALYLRVEKIKQQNKLDKQHIDIMEKALKVYIYDSLKVVRNAGYEIIDSFASGIEKKTTRYALKLLTRSYQVNAKQLRRDICQYAYNENGYCF